jgi:predicted ArsR family transcriptional regulator
MSRISDQEVEATLAKIVELLKAGPRSPGELAREVGVTTRTIHRYLTRIVERGFDLRPEVGRPSKYRITEATTIPVVGIRPKKTW